MIDYIDNVKYRAQEDYFLFPTGLRCTCFRYFKNYLLFRALSLFDQEIDYSTLHTQNSILFRTMQNIRNIWSESIIYLAILLTTRAISLLVCFFLSLYD